MTACEPGEQGCIRFEIGDINGLQAEVYNNARSNFIGARCDTEAADIERDEFGRILAGNSGCGGLNAGALLIVTVNLIGKEGEPFAIDAQNEFTTEQIWNQPAWSYTPHRFELLDEAEAANLVATGERDGELTSYAQFNPAARGWALVDLELHWVTETFGPNVAVIGGDASSRSTRMVAVIELDRPDDDIEAEVIGGEYLDDPSVGANRLRVAPFAWTAIDVGPETPKADGSFGHNPFIKGEVVKRLIELGTTPQ